MGDRRLPAWFLVVVTVVALGAATTTFQLLDDSGGDDGGSLSGDLDEIDVSSLSYQRLDGTTVALEDHRDRPVVVNFFASWCTPCRTEIPGFVEVSRAAGDAIGFVGLAVNDRLEDTRAFVQELGVDYEVGRDVDAALSIATGIGVRLPGTVVLDANGEVVARHLGALDRDELVALLTQHLDDDIGGRLTRRLDRDSR